VKKEAARSSETLVWYYITILRPNNPEEHDVKLHRPENFNLDISR